MNLYLALLSAKTAPRVFQIGSGGQKGPAEYHCLNKYHKRFINIYILKLKLSVPILSYILARKISPKQHGLMGKLNELFRAKIAFLPEPKLYCCASQDSLL